MKRAVRAASVAEAIEHWAAAGLDVARLRALELTLLAHVVEHQERVWADARGCTADLPAHLRRIAPVGNDVTFEHRVVRIADLVRQRDPRELVEAFFAPSRGSDSIEVITMQSPRVEFVVDSRGPGYTRVLQRRPFAMLVDGDPPHAPMPAGREVPQSGRA